MCVSLHISACKRASECVRARARVLLRDFLSARPGNSLVPAADTRAHSAPKRTHEGSAPVGSDWNLILEDQRAGERKAHAWSHGEEPGLPCRQQVQDAAGPAVQHVCVCVRACVCVCVSSLCSLGGS